MPELLTSRQAASYLQVPESTLRYWRRNGTGPRHAWLGKHLRYRRSELDQWVQAQEEKAAAG